MAGLRVPGGHYGFMGYHRAQRARMFRAIRAHVESLFASGEADAFCAIGTSGEALIYRLADALPARRFFVLKKPGVSSHSSDIMRIESTGWGASAETEKPWLIDDFVVSGRTVLGVQQRVPLVGVLVYRPGESLERIGLICTTPVRY